MAVPWIYPARILQLFLGLIVTGLASFVIASLHDEWSFSNAVDFLLFLGCWTAFFAVPYLAAAPIWLPHIAHRVIIPAIEVITMLLWFAGFIAIGALLPSPGGCVWDTCHALQAATVVGSVQWMLFAATTYYTIIDLIHMRHAEEGAKQATQETQENPATAHLSV